MSTDPIKVTNRRRAAARKGNGTRTTVCTNSTGIPGSNNTPAGSRNKGRRDKECGKRICALRHKPMVGAVQPAGMCVGCGKGAEYKVGNPMGTGSKCAWGKGVRGGSGRYNATESPGMAFRVVRKCKVQNGPSAERSGREVYAYVGM